MPSVNVLSRRVRERRKSLGLNQGDLAAAIGTTQGAVSHYESGETSPTADVLVELARALNTSADWLLGLSNQIQLGQTEDFGLTPTERELLMAIRAFSERQQQLLLEVTDAIHRMMP